jgi:putative acetyltransferase
VSDSPALTIRGQQTDDWNDLYALLSLEDVIRETTELPYPAEEAFRERFGGSSPNTHTLIAETGLPSGRRRLVGAVWVSVIKRYRRRHTAEVSLVAHPDYRGSEMEDALLRKAIDLADDWLGLRRLEAVVYADDTDMIALYARHGFEREAVMRRYAVRAGAYSDAVLLGRLRPPVTISEMEGDQAT